MNNVILYLCLYLRVKYHLDACKRWCRDLVPDSGSWYRLLLFPDFGTNANPGRWVFALSN